MRKQINKHGTKLTPFERETERRRREMRGHLAQRVGRMPVKLLKTLMHTMPAAIVTRDAAGCVLHERLPHNNPFRQMARKTAKAVMA